MVARLERRDRGTYLVNNSDAFMTQDTAGLAAWKIALEDMQVCSADGGFGNPDNSVRGRGDFRLGAVQKSLLADGLINQCFHRGCAFLRSEFPCRRLRHCC